MSGSSLHHRYLDAMGIQVWARREAAVPDLDAEEVVEPEAPPPETAMGDVSEVAVAAVSPAVHEGRADIANLDWPALASEVAGCRQCGLHESRSNTVFGVGNRSADWLIVGEAPGAEEDKRGEPFVGRAGQLLDAMLRSVNLDRQRAYIANILKCRPPNNRDPLPEEVVACEPYLARQIDLIQPRIILAVGRIAAQNLLKSSEPIGRLRGQVHRYADTGIPVIVTYHPAYLLRSPLEKRKAWADLRSAMKLVEETGA